MPVTVESWHRMASAFRLFAVTAAQGLLFFGSQLVGRQLAGAIEARASSRPTTQRIALSKRKTWSPSATVRESLDERRAVGWGERIKTEKMAA